MLRERWESTNTLLLISISEAGNLQRVNLVEKIISEARENGKIILIWGR
jgi:hypothetical protein